MSDDDKRVASFFFFSGLGLFWPDALPRILANQRAALSGNLLYGQ